MNRDAVVYAHVGLFKQDVQLAVQNQIGISKRVIVDQIIQLLPLEAIVGNFVFNGGAVWLPSSKTNSTQAVSMLN